MKFKGFPAAFIAILGSSTEKVNFTTVGDIAVASMNPPMVMIALHKDHYITKQLQENNFFSANIVDAHMQAIVEYCSTHSGHYVNKDKFNYDFHGNIPFLVDAPLVLDLKVISETKYLHRCIFLCEVIESYGHAKEILIYTMNHHFHRFSLED
ncbi:MAG: flavin reductase [Clostridia bacterium]|nr:flavin reductase [Clostridia bacterium]